MAFHRWMYYKRDDEELRPQRITVHEELEGHVMAENIPSAVANEIESNALRYPGVSIVEHHRREYPRGSMAAHILGYLGDSRPEEIEGRRCAACRETLPWR